MLPLHVVHARSTKLEPQWLFGVWLVRGCVEPKETAGKSTKSARVGEKHGLAGRVGLLLQRARMGLGLVCVCCSITLHS